MKCPYCKKELNNIPPIDSLKLHIEKSIRREEKYAERRNNRNTKTLEKWKSWKEAIETLESEAQNEHNRPNIAGKQR